eukprot:m.314757 g.314757  ORF g.314757 m.314757 type:complete len:301 (+) comp55422_c1_seq8:398-1300(+)
MQPHDRSPSRALLARDSKYKATSSQHDDELTGIADSYLVDLSDQHARGEDDPGAVLSHASLFTPHELQDLISALKKLLRSLESCEFAPASEPVPQKKRRISNLWVENLLLITFVWQALTLLVLWVIDNSTSSDSNAGVIAAIVSLAVFEFVHVVVIVSVSVKLSKQLVHRTAKDSVLAQSYLSTLILFAGIYTLSYRIAPQHWVGVDDVLSSSSYALDVFAKFFYFSTVTMTCTGGEIHPFDCWYLYLIVTFECLLGILYGACIFSRGLAKLGSESSVSAPTESLLHRAWVYFRSRVATI